MAFEKRLLFEVNLSFQQRRLHGVRERKLKEKQIRRSQILDAARMLLFSQGIEKISISRIAKVAELGVGTIYFHYKNKEDIFIALQQEGILVLHTIISKISASAIEPDDKLRQIARAYYEFTETHTEYYNIINYFLSSPKVFFEADKKEQVDMSGTKILTVIQEILIAGNDAGFFMEKDPGKFSIMFWGTIHGLIQFKKLEQTTLQNQAHKEIYDYSVDKLIQSIIWD